MKYRSTARLTLLIPNMASSHYSFLFRRRFERDGGTTLTCLNSRKDFDLLLYVADNKAREVNYLSAKRRIGRKDKNKVNPRQTNDSGINVCQLSAAILESFESSCN